MCVCVESQRLCLVIRSAQWSLDCSRNNIQNLLSSSILEPLWLLKRIQSENNRTEFAQKIEKTKINSPHWAYFDNNILQVTYKVANRSSTVFDCGQYNPAICESHLTYHANMLELCKVGLMPFKQVRTIKGQHVWLCVSLWSVCKAIAAAKGQDWTTQFCMVMLSQAVKYSNNCCRVEQTINIF